MTKALFFFALLLPSIIGLGQSKYADVVIDSFYSGANPAFSSFYGTNGNGGGIVLVNPSVCLGNNPWFVSLPKDSYLTIGFVDNTIFDAPNQDDIFIQEKGSAAELADIYVSSDFGVSFTYFGQINGGVTNAIDLQDIGYTGLVNAIKIVGLDNNGSSPGFDLARIYGIDGANCSANAALTIPDVCQDSILDLRTLGGGKWEGSLTADSLLVTQDTGTKYLTHIVEDVYPICPNDTVLIPVSVVPCDCSGTPFGHNEVDICGICQDPLDSLFGKSCLDCAGVPFGNFTYDACHQCLSQDDVTRCGRDNIAFIPNVFSPNGDGLNDYFRVYFRQGVVGTVVDYSIFSRWGELVYRQSSPSLRGGETWWDGRIHGKTATSGVYIYHIRVELENGELLEYSGDVTLLR